MGGYKEENVTRLALSLIMAGVLACAEWPPPVESVPQIEALPLGQRDVRCITCGDPEVLALARRLKAVEYVYLSQSSTVTDRAVVALAELRSLRQLVVNDASRLSDASLLALAASPSLRELTLYDASEISEHGLLAFKQSSRLERLYMSGITDLEKRTVDELRESIPGCIIRVVGA